MNVTVIVCTYNRCRSLANTLDSVAVSVLPESVEWEVLVVDNNSSDGTRDVVEQFLRRYPNRFRYLFEPCQGKSYALNSGIREAQGKILAFMDDDVTVERTWLKNLTSSLRGDEWAGAGGRILPRHAFTSPRWLALDGPYSLVGVLGLFDRGNVAGELDWPPHGANMCFRKEMFERYGFFRTDLGPPPVEVGGEDTEFGRRLVSAGERLRYEASAAVYHDVAEQRLCKEYFLVFSSILEDRWRANGGADQISGEFLGATLVFLRQSLLRSQKNCCRGYSPLTRRGDSFTRSRSGRAPGKSRNSIGSLAAKTSKAACLRGIQLSFEPSERCDYSRFNAL